MQDSEEDDSYDCIWEDDERLCFNPTDIQNTIDSYVIVCGNRYDKDNSAAIGITDVWKDLAIHLKYVPAMIDECKIIYTTKYCKEDMYSIRFSCDNCYTCITKRIEESLPLLRNIIEQDPNNIYAIAKLKEIYSSNIEKYSEEFQTLLNNIMDKDPSVYYWKSRLLSQTGTAEHTALLIQSLLMQDQDPKIIRHSTFNLSYNNLKKLVLYLIKEKQIKNVNEIKELCEKAGINQENKEKGKENKEDKDEEDDNKEEQDNLDKEDDNIEDEEDDD